MNNKNKNANKELKRRVEGDKETERDFVSKEQANVQKRIELDEFQSVIRKLNEKIVSYRLSRPQS